MPTCQHCHTKWTWTQTIKRLFTLTCPYCGQKQYESASSKQRGGIFGVITPLILLPIIIGFDVSMGAALILAIMVSAGIFGFYPFILKLSNEEEPFF